MKRSLLAAV